jgi:hypothetical protein
LIWLAGDGGELDMTWEELAEIHMASARHLFSVRGMRHERAICGRAYYAVYALLTSRLPRKARFAHGWNNPPHSQLPGYVATISGLHEPERRMIRHVVRRLRQRREEADYRPAAAIDWRSAQERMRDAGRIFAILSKRL